MGTKLLVSLLWNCPQSHGSQNVDNVMWPFCFLIISCKIIIIIVIALMICLSSTFLIVFPITDPKYLLWSTYLSFLQCLDSCSTLLIPGYRRPLHREGSKLELAHLSRRHFCVNVFNLRRVVTCLVSSTTKCGRPSCPWGDAGWQSTSPYVCESLIMPCTFLRFYV